MKKKGERNSPKSLILTAIPTKMSGNICQAFADEVTCLFHNKLYIVADYITNNKGVSCTVEELAQLLNLEVKNNTNNQGTPQPTATKTTRAPRGQLSEGEGCQYKFKKGAKEGSLCGARCASGSTYCQTHNKAVQGSTNKPTSTGARTTPGTYTGAPSVNNLTRVEPPQEEAEIRATRWNKHKNIGVEQSQSIIFYIGDEYIAFGKQTSTGPRRLNAEDIITVRRLRLKLPEDHPEIDIQQYVDTVFPPSSPAQVNRTAPTGPVAQPPVSGFQGPPKPAQGPAIPKFDGLNPVNA